jgi:hypothetical protein
VSARRHRFGQNEGMSRQPGGNGELARGASAAAAKGAALIGLAVIVGVFLLQRVDTSNAGSPTTPVKSPKTTTTKPHKPKTTTTSSSTVVAAPLKTPDQLKVLVLNGGAASGAARTLRTKLVQVGYTNEPQANTWDKHTQTGTTLMCKSGLDREKIALSQQTALTSLSVKVIDFPSPAPPFSTDVDCVVVVGA